jgi:multiple sugar transport system substrate-binding protein
MKMKHVFLSTSILVFLFAAYSVPALAQSKIRIEVGDISMPSSSLGWFEEQIRSFEKAYPNIDVALKNPVMPRRPDTPIQSIPSLAENVIGIVGPYGYEIGHLASRELILPLDDRIESSDYPQNAYPENVWKDVTFEEKIWGIPWSMDAIWLVCNKPLFEKAGIDALPETWDEFMAVAQKLTVDSNGDNVSEQWGFYFPSASIGTVSWLWISRIIQDDRIDKTDPVAFFTSEESIEHLGFVKNFYQSDSVKHGKNMALGPNTLQLSQIGMFVLHNFYTRLSPQFVQELQTFGRKEDLAYTFLPSNDAPITCFGFRYYLAIRKSTEEKEKASWEFIKWITRKDAKMPAVWSGFPVRQDITSTPKGYKDVPLASIARTRTPEFEMGWNAYPEMNSLLSRYFSNSISLSDVILGIKKVVRERAIVPEQTDLDELFR